MAVDFHFLKKLAKPRFSLSFLSSKPARVIGVQIGAYSSKMVQLRRESERAVLETYGELRNEKYLAHPESTGGGGTLRYLDQDIISLLGDLLRESNASAKEAVCVIPASAAFITTLSFPRSLGGEVARAVPYEARKYVPIPISEVILEWMILDEAEAREEIKILLMAVPREVVEKFQRVIKGVGLNIRALEVEPFSTARSLIGQDPTPTLIVNMGHQSTTLTFVDRGLVRGAHTLGRGSHELTLMLARGLAVGEERSEAAKREFGLSERIEEREITSVMAPLVETLLAEIRRLIGLYNRRAPRKIQRVNITGGGAHLKGMVEYTASKLGIETARGNPFARLVTPPFLERILAEIGPNFSAAVGAALREFTPR